VWGLRRLLIVWWEIVDRNRYFQCCNYCIVLNSCIHIWINMFIQQWLVSFNYCFGYRVALNSLLNFLITETCSEINHRTPEYDPKLNLIQ
jgi:hypothetical protein